MFGFSVMIADLFVIVRRSSAAWPIVAIGAVVGILIWVRAFRISHRKRVAFLPETRSGAFMVGAFFVYVGVGLSLVLGSNPRRASAPWPNDYMLLMPAILGISGAILLNVRAHRIQRNRPSPGDCQSCGYNLTGNVSGICPECGTPVRGARAGDVRAGHLADP